MRRLLISLALVLVIPVFSGCDTSGYRTFEQRKGYDHYSFEYLASYRITMNHAYSEQNAPNGVRLMGKLTDGSEIVMAVNIGRHSEDAQARASTTLMSNVTELLERSTGQISGVPCEIITVYTEPMGGNLTSKFEKVAFFDYNGRSWDFFVYSEQIKSNEVAADFERLLSTFKLLL